MQDMGDRATRLPTIEEQYEECRSWRDWFKDAGYDVYIAYTEDPAPLDREWQVYGRDTDGDAIRVASFDCDGCGASWHGPDKLWLTVVGPHVDLMD